jgi:ribonuclease D
MQTILTQAPALAELAARLAQHDRIGLDTEFMRVHTFLPELALIQLRVDGETVLVDPVALPQLAALSAPLRQATPVKLMHSASEDLLALAPVAGGALQGLFDTQIAAAFAGLGAGIGYQRLVLELLGVALPKAETRSNWLARPLSASQIEYAAADVEHLPALHDLLLARLEGRGMLAWCAEECARMARDAADDSAPANPHWEFRNGWRWPLDAQAMLKRLLAWRESVALRIDKPRNWIYDNPGLAALALAPPQGAAALGEHTRRQRSFPKRELESLLQLLEQPVSDEERGLQPIPAPLDDAQERRFEALKAKVAARAAELDLPPALIASRRVLEAVVRGIADPDETGGWRAQVLGMPLESIA